MDARYRGRFSFWTSQIADCMVQQSLGTRALFRSDVFVKDTVSRNIKVIRAISETPRGAVLSAQP
jgi:hypothetical protein